MRRALVIVLLGSLTSVLGCRSDATNQGEEAATIAPTLPPTRWTQAQRDELANVRRLAVAATTVDVYKMTDLAEGRSIDDLGERSKGTGVLLGMPYDSRRLVLRTDRSTLIDLLFDDANYLQYPNACVFHADFGYRFESGYGAVEVVFCGTCGDAVVEGGQFRAAERQGSPGPREPTGRSPIAPLRGLRCNR